jgi:DNA-binding NarL/FixJ family response regulator
MEKINIYIVDDHLLFREGFRLILGNLDYIGSVTEYESGEQFLKIAAHLPEGIAFIDINMPGRDGIETTEELKHINTKIRVIALTMYEDSIYYKKMIKAGASGFILKSSCIEEVERAIKDVQKGGKYFSGVLIENIMSEKQERTSNAAQLTEREIDVLLLICKGLSNNQIAKNLNLSKRTIDKHRENILSKTNAGNTAGLVIFAIKEGIIIL